MNAKILLTIFTFFFLSANSNASVEDRSCRLDDQIYERILAEVTKGNKQAIKVLPQCFKEDRKLILKASLIDPSEFNNAGQILKEDENFVSRLIKAQPSILKYASPKLLGNKRFMKNATYIYRDALQYALPALLNNKLFMKKMIITDSRNYIFASKRIKSIPNYAAIALEDDGLLISYAPASIKSSKKMAIIAIKSSAGAFQSISKKLQKDKSLRKLARHKTSIRSVKSLRNFLEENYLKKEVGKNLGYKIDNQSKYFENNVIIKRNYITKWQRYLNYDSFKPEQSTKLISADNRNYPVTWKEDLEEYPNLIHKIEKFFLRHNIDQNTIDNFHLNYLWKIKDKPLTLAFNIYLLRDSQDIDLGPEFSNVNSLTAIVQKNGKSKWKLSVVEVIFDSEIKVDVAYQNGHKRYFLWDLYILNKKDKNPKLIYKVEDRFKEYFEVYEEQSGGKYRLLYHIEPNIKKLK